MNLLLTRPYNDSLKTKKLIERKTDHKVFISPAININYFDPALDLKENSNLIITSANGIKALGRISNSRNYRIFPIGSSSMEAAKALGYENISISRESILNSDVKTLLDHITKTCSPDEEFFHLTSNMAKKKLGKRLSDLGYKYNKLEIYKVEKNPFDNDISEKIKTGFFDGYIFFSERSARSFLDNVETTDLQNSLLNTQIFCLSPEISSVFSNYENLKLYYPERINLEAFIEILGEHK